MYIVRSIYHEENDSNFILEDVIQHMAEASGKNCITADFDPLLCYTCTSEYCISVGCFI